MSGRFGLDRDRRRLELRFERPRDPLVEAPPKFCDDVHGMKGLFAAGWSAGGEVWVLIVGSGGDQCVPELQDTEVFAQPVFTGRAQLAGPLTGDAELVADGIERRILEVITPDRVGLPLGQPVERVEQLGEQVAPLGPEGRIGRERVGEVFVEDRSAGLFGREVGLSGPHLVSGEVQRFGDFDGQGTAPQFVGELVLDPGHGPSAFAPPSGKGIEAPQLVEHGAANPHETEGAGLAGRAVEPQGGVHQGLASGGGEIVTINVGREARGDTGQRAVHQVEQLDRIRRRGGRT